MRCSNNHLCLFDFFSSAAIFDGIAKILLQSKTSKRKSRSRVRFCRWKWSTYVRTDLVSSIEVDSVAESSPSGMCLIFLRVCLSSSYQFIIAEDFAPLFGCKTHLEQFPKKITNNNCNDLLLKPSKACSKPEPSSKIIRDITLGNKRTYV